MAGINYSSLAATAQKLIQENGRLVTITMLSRAAANADQPWRGPTTTPAETIELLAVFDDDEESDPRGELVRVGDKKCIISALDADPALVERFDSLTDSDQGEVWKIASVKTVQPGSVRVVYELMLRA